jgi:DNA-binding transcriptional MerR regulator
MESQRTGEAIIGIGDFALLTGLSVTRLRRYHDLGVLVPARVDSQSGYRSYAPEQIELGRRVSHLRQMDLPLGDVARVVASAESAARVLREHRDRLAERLTTTTQMLDLVDELIGEEHRHTSPMTVQLVEVVLRVEDVEETVAFYRDVLDVEFQADDHNGTLPVHYDACAGAWDPEGFFMLTIYPANGRPTRSSLGFGVPDVDETWRRARARRATEVEAPTDSGYMPRRAVFEDNAGNRVSVYHRRGDW